MQHISLNFTYADVQGNIGYHSTGMCPLRQPNHDGSTPAPGYTGDLAEQKQLIIIIKKNLKDMKKI